MWELSDCGSVAVVDTEAPDWVKLGCFVCSKGESPDDDDDVVGGADGMLDGIGGEVLTLAAQHLLRVRAIIVRFGGDEQADLFPQAVQRLRLQVMRETVESFMKTRDVVQRVEAAFAWIGEARYRPKAWHVASWSEAAECMKDQPTWTRFQTQVKPGRIGRIILKFD
eukprot:s863_g9.t1